MILGLLLPQSHANTVTRALLAALAVVAAVLYASGLDRVPLHLHHDEIYFGLISHSVAQTLRDPNGRLLPVLFQMGDTQHWYPPVHIYVSALWLKLLPLTDAAVRVPNAALGVANIVLMFFVALRMIQNRWQALAAAAMLALTPAHFINSRISTDCLYPVTFILMWLLLLQRYREQPSPTRLFAVTSVLAIGMYAYIASVVMMPVYVAMTFAVLWWERRAPAAFASAAAGFAWPVAFGAVFLLLHPGVIGDYIGKYQLASQSTTQLNALQQLRESLTPWNVSDHLNLFHSSFAPGYLFVTGGSNLAHSTRLAGVFLAPMAILMLVGLVDTIRRPSALKLLVAAGFFSAPIAAVIVPEDFAIPRMMGLLPFGVLLATIGLARMWESRLEHSPRTLSQYAGGSIAFVGVAYTVLALARQSHLSGSGVAMAAAGAALWLIGRMCDDRRNWQPVAVAILALMPLQFAFFAADYFGDYRARSAARYEYNIRGALEQAVALRDRTPQATIYINDDILFVRGYWDYYLRVFKRPELKDDAVWFNTENGLPAGIAAGSIVVTNVSERAVQRLSAVPGLVQVAQATDPVPGTTPPAEQPTFFIYQQR